MKATRSLLSRIHLFPDLKQKAGDEGYKEQDYHKFLRDPPVPLSHGCVRPSDWSYFELLPFDKALPNTGYEVTMYCPLQVPSTYSVANSLEELPHPCVQLGESIGYKWTSVSPLHVPSNVFL